MFGIMSASTILSPKNTHQVNRHIKKPLY